MRTDDPVILGQLKAIEAACAGLRMACGFPPLVETPETTAKRKPLYECQEPSCSRMCYTRDDLEAHRLIDHDVERTAA